MQAPSTTDRLLARFRSFVEGETVGRTIHTLARAGQWALWLVVLFWAWFGIYSWHLYRDDRLISWAIGVMVLVLLFIYPVRRTIQTVQDGLETLQEKPDSLLASTGLVDSIAWIAIGGGGILLVTMGIGAVRYQLVALSISGVAMFTVCELTGLVLLAPKRLGVSPREKNGSPAIEAIGTGRVLLRTAAQMVPAVFGIGLLWVLANYAWSAWDLVHLPKTEAGVVASLRAWYVTLWLVGFLLWPIVFSLFYLAGELVLGVAAGLVTRNKE